jgi:hypothetical protein
VYADPNIYKNYLYTQREWPLINIKFHEETLDFPEVVAEDGVNVGLIRPVEEQPRRGIQPLVPEH